MARAGKTEQLQSFTQRVFSAREHAGFTQKHMAKLIGTNQTAYAKYEVRSFMPVSLIHSFCLACHISVEWLITGEGKGGVPLRDKPALEKRRGRKHKRKVA